MVKMRRILLTTLLCSLSSCLTPGLRRLNTVSDSKFMRSLPDVVLGRQVMEEAGCHFFSQEEPQQLILHWSVDDSRPIIGTKLGALVIQMIRYDIPQEAKTAGISELRGDNLKILLSLNAESIPGLDPEKVNLTGTIELTSTGVHELLKVTGYCGC